LAKKSKQEGKVNDLVEKLKSGEIASKDALKELEKRKLVEGERWEIIIWVVYFVFLLLPPVSKQLKLEFLAFFTQLSSIPVPTILIYVLLAISFVGILVGIWATRIHYQKGGLNHDETIILFKDGPYQVMRHPAILVLTLPILLPIILSPLIPFTILSVAAIITMVVYTYYGCYMEEKKLDIPKWGDEYLQYMKEVPRFNFILGLWRLHKRKRERAKKMS